MLTLKIHTVKANHSLIHSLTHNLFATLLRYSVKSVFSNTQCLEVKASIHLFWLRENKENFVFELLFVSSLL